MSTSTAHRPGFVGRLFLAEPVARTYHWLTDHPLWAEQNLSLLEHLTGGPDEPRILDLGAGNGVGTVALARALQGRGEVIGVEYAAPMVARAERAARQAKLRNLRFVHGDATGLVGFDAASVDFVVAHSFLYLVPDARGVLREARRVLRPRGRLVFMEPREEASLRGALSHGISAAPGLLGAPKAAARLACALSAWRVMSRLEGRRTEGALRALLGEAGFSGVHFSPTLGGLGHHVIAEVPA